MINKLYLFFVPLLFFTNLSFSKSFNKYSLSLERELDQLYSEFVNSKGKQRAKIAYELAESLYSSGYYQSAELFLMSPLRAGIQLENSLDMLSQIVGKTRSDDLAMYVAKKMKPTRNETYLYFRARADFKKGSYSRALRSLKKISQNSDNYGKALYLMGSIFSKRKEYGKATVAFKRATNFRNPAGFTDEQRVAALMGLARSHYAFKNWDQANKLYGLVPRDSEFWHESIFERSWSYMRAGRFRSALSNFQTMQSEFYKDSYWPETIVLRGVIYLYICRYDEVETTIGPVR